MQRSRCHTPIPAQHCLLIICAQRDLDEALPALDAAVASLKNLSRTDVVEVKSMQNPPQGKEPQVLAMISACAFHFQTVQTALSCVEVCNTTSMFASLLLRCYVCLNVAPLLPLLSIDMRNLFLVLHAIVFIIVTAGVKLVMDSTCHCVHHRNCRCQACDGFYMPLCSSS
jgi:hypothetical protein